MMTDNEKVVMPACLFAVIATTWVFGDTWWVVLAFIYGWVAHKITVGD